MENGTHVKSVKITVNIFAVWLLSLIQIITPLGPVNNLIIDSRPEFPSVSEGPRGSLMS